MGLVFQELHRKLTSLFGVSGFEHVLSDPPLLAVAWPPANHVAPDDYAEHLLPSDAQLEINTDKNPQISLQNFRVWTRKNKWEGDSRPEMKTVLGRETSLKVGKSWTEITLAAWDCLISALKRTIYVCLLPKQDLRILITSRFTGNAFQALNFIFWPWEITLDE